MSKQRFDRDQLVKSVLTDNVYRIKIFEPVNNKYCVSQENKRYAWSFKWLPAALLRPLF